MTIDQFKIGFIKNMELTLANSELDTWMLGKVGISEHFSFYGRLLQFQKIFLYSRFYPFKTATLRIQRKYKL